MFDFIHPMVVHFPIALIIVAFVSELTGAVLRRDFFVKAALLLLVLGACGVIAAFLTGDEASHTVGESGAIRAALEMHEEAGEFTLWTVIVVALVRMLFAYKRWMHGWRQWVAVILLVLCTAAVARTGYLGGELVFRYGGGIKAQQQPTVPGAESTTPAESRGDD